MPVGKSDKEGAYSSSTPQRAQVARVPPIALAPPLPSLAEEGEDVPLPILPPAPSPPAPRTAIAVSGQVSGSSNILSNANFSTSCRFTSWEVREVTRSNLLRLRATGIAKGTTTESSSFEWDFTTEVHMHNTINTIQNLHQTSHDRMIVPEGGKWYVITTTIGDDESLQRQRAMQQVALSPLENARQIPFVVYIAVCATSTLPF